MYLKKKSVNAYSRSSSGHMRHILALTSGSRSLTSWNLNAMSSIHHYRIPQLTHNCQAAHVSNQSIVTKAGTAFSQHNIMITCLLSFFQYIFHVPRCEELAFFNINYTSCFCCFVNQIRLTAKKRRYLQNI